MWKDVRVEYKADDLVFMDGQTFICKGRSDQYQALMKNLIKQANAQGFDAVKDGDVLKFNEKVQRPK